MNCHFTTTGLIVALSVSVALAGPEWQPWNEHSALCSTTCGEGVRCRMRSCMTQAVLGHVEVSVDDCQGGEQASRECLPCRAYAVCPTNGGWSFWSQWSECLLNRKVTKDADPAVNKTIDEFEGIAERELDVLSKGHGLAKQRDEDVHDLDQDCGEGLRKRTRDCDQPKPSTEGLLCGDEYGRIQYEVCDVPCSADYDFLTTVKEILVDELIDSPNTLYYVNLGGAITLDCANEAYDMALEAIKPYQLLQIEWRLNNKSVSTLQTRLEKFMEKAKELKGIGSSEVPSDLKEKKLEVTQLRVVGTQLTIDPVDSDRIGVYGCYMVLDGEHLLMRTFTLLTRALRVRNGMESEDIEMTSNAETFINDNLPLMEWATVLWYHNGLSDREHMLLDWHERSRKVTLSYRFTGVWECYIVLNDRHFKVNEFLVVISEEGSSFLQKFDDIHLTYFIASCFLALYAIVGFPLAVVTLRHREENWITAEERKCIEYVRQINYLYMARYVRKIS